MTFCGDLKAQRDGNLENEKSTDLAVTGFVSDYYAVEVEIFISKLPILNDKIELEMIFTPYLSKFFYSLTSVFLINILPISN